MRVIAVVGARPNFVKAAPLVPALREAGVTADLVHTGQHYDESMSDVFFSDLSLPEPRWWLGVGSGTHAVQTGTAMVRLESLFAEERPDAVMVIGDVNSTLAGALAAAKLRLPVVHLEAGLRSGDMSMPEEVNRLVTDQLSAMHLAPTRDAAANLAGEGVERSRVHMVGNIMAEVALGHVARARERRPAALDGIDGAYAVATIHRAENTERPEALGAIVEALDRSGMPVVLPAHPRSKALLEAVGAGSRGSVRVVEPLGYLDMLSVVAGAAVVVTDSGGLQEEACTLRVPCVTVRRNTERTVTLACGANRLAEAETQAVLDAIAGALVSPREWALPELWDEGVSGRVAEAVSAGVVPAAGCD